MRTITASKRFKGMRMQERIAARAHKGKSDKRLTKGVPGKNSAIANKLRSA